MAPGVVMQRGRASSVLLLLRLLTFLGAAHATQWTVGDSAVKWPWSINADRNFYTLWAANKALQTGDTLLFKFDNSSHTVLQLAREQDFKSCILNASISMWRSGADSVFISEAGTYYFVCGAPSHCEQGMKFSIAATGSPVAAPPVGHAPPSLARHSRGVLVVSTILALAATFYVTVV